jgi:hypothetical protein
MKHVFPVVGSVVLVLSVAACATEQTPEAASGTGVVRAGELSTDPCIATDISPALIETETIQILETPEVLDADGGVVTPAVYRSEASQRIIRERETVEFEAVCSPEESPEFVATLQRALKARGHLTEDITGRMDGNTKRAIRSYQASRGLNSDILSMDTARELGLIAYERDNI